MWALLLAALAAAASGQGPRPETSASADLSEAERILLQMADRIADEAARQRYVNQRMDRVIGRFRDILFDVASNDLLRRADGPGMERLVQALGVLSGRHVPRAARHLEEARQRLAALRPNLTAADRTIALIVAELDRILDQGPGAGRDFLRELELLIEEEKRTHEATREWGRELLQDPEKAEPRRRDTAADQRAVAGRTADFLQRLAKAAEAETDPAEHKALAQAHAEIRQPDVPNLLQDAARDILGKKPVAATGTQAKAIEALEKAAEHLRRDDLASDLQAMKELRERLQKILKEQTDLRQDTEAVPAQDFARQQNALQVGQRDLGNDLRDASRDIPGHTSPDLPNHLDAAQGHMTQAEQQMAATRQQPAVGSQKSAEQALQKAIDTLDQDIAAAEQQWDQQYQPMQSLADLAQQALDLARKQEALKRQTGQTQPQSLPQLNAPQTGLQQQAQALNAQMPMAQFQQAAGHMQQAAQSLQQSRQQPAMGQQQQAIDALKSAAQALQQAQAAMDLAMQQAALMQQTGQTPAQGLPQLAPSQTGLQQQAQAGQFQQAAGHMQQASQSLQASQGQQAMAGQQAAISSLMGQAGQAMGMQPGQGMMPGMAPGMGMMPGMMPGMGMMASPYSQTNDPQEFGLRYFGRQQPAGPEVGRGSDDWTPLGDRRRDALYQDYADQLPREYRRLLSDYYEALSAERGGAGSPGPGPSEVTP
ncbi:MAG: hypothetical protein R6X20_18125 [Phycisphaerae bacterium]